MTFDLATWKRKVGERLSGVNAWVDRAKTEHAPQLVYAALCGASLWPLVEAARSGHFIPVVVALGAIAGGVGGNLIPEQIQRWKDAADGVDEDAITHWVEARVGDPEVREALDQVIEKLEAIALAQAKLDETGRQWFDQQLRAELGRLGNLPRFEARLTGSGAIAQNGGVAAGAGGTAIGNVFGDVRIGQQMGPDPRILRLAYLNQLFDACSHLSLSGIDPKAASDPKSAGLNLDAVYTALITRTPEEKDRIPGPSPRDQARSGLSALAQLDRHPRLVLLGDPGSGKSTFVNFAGMCLAGEVLENPQVNLSLLTAPLPPDEGDEQGKAKRQPWSHGRLLPVRIVLRDFVVRGLPEPGEPATADHLWRFIETELGSTSLGDFAADLRRELLDKGGLFLLDGLDEVPEADRRREQVKRAVEGFAATYRRYRMVVTSRIYAYQRQDWRLRGFAEATLAGFTAAQIRQFVDRWYAQIAALRGIADPDARGRAELLKRAIFNSASLTTLAERPLLLTLMASLHAWRGGSLPEGREALYADAMDLLLDSWESPKVVRDAQGNPRVEQPSLSEWLKVDRDKVRALLNELAYKAHACQPELLGTADVAESELVGGLMRLTENPEVKPKRLVEYLSHRAGLLLPRGIGVYTLPHRTFQEYLAACHLTSDPEFADTMARLVRTEPNRWREVTLLAAAKAKRGALASVWELTQALCEQDVDSPDATLQDAWGALLTAQALVETAELGRTGNRFEIVKERVRGWLKSILGGDDLPAPERAEAGRLLARLGDPRAEVTSVEAMECCRVPPRAFWMREGEAEHLDTRLAYAYWIGRNLVTHAQFMNFVDAGGYREPRYWTEAARDGVWKPSGEVHGRRDDAARSGPHDLGFPYTLQNHPVVGVTWYEALAFIRWLTEHFHREECLPEGFEVRLPSEAEWEKAARGGIELPAEPVIRAVGALDKVEVSAGRVPNPEPKRRYPWGTEADPERANYAATHVGSTSAVGCFPLGASPYGCQDMAGNCWEWTRSLRQRWGQDSLGAGLDIPRVLRGGAFDNVESFLRCTFRSGFSPDLSGRNFGFRVVVSPSTSAL